MAVVYNYFEPIPIPDPQDQQVQNLQYVLIQNLIKS